MCERYAVSHCLFIISFFFLLHSLRFSYKGPVFTSFSPFSLPPSIPSVFHLISPKIHNIFFNYCCTHICIYKSSLLSPLVVAHMYLCFWTTTWDRLNYLEVLPCRLALYLLAAINYFQLFI